jgi:hypothetical protein
LQQATGAAVETLVKQLKARKAGDAIRAAVAVLKLAGQGLDVFDLVERVEALEREKADRPRLQPWRGNA